MVLGAVTASFVGRSLGLEVLLTGGVYSWASWLYSYNRDAWMTDTALRQTRRYQQDNMKIAQETMHREDIRDLATHQITVMNNFILLETLILSLAVTLLLDANLPDTATDYVVNAYIICLASSLTLLVISIITAVMAAHLANKYASDLLLTRVRPAWQSFSRQIDKWAKDEGTRAFDKQSLIQIFKPPLARLPKWRGPECFAGLRGGKARETQLGAARKLPPSDPSDPEAAPAPPDPQLLAEEGTSMAEEQQQQDRWLEEFWHPCEDVWRPFSECSNRALYFGTKNLCQALCYVCIATVYGNHGGAWALWAIAIAFVVINFTLSEMSKWQRPRVGDRVKVLLTDREGTIQKDFQGGHPYMIMYDDGMWAVCRENPSPERIREDQVQRVSTTWLWNNLDGFAPILCAVVVISSKADAWAGHGVARWQVQWEARILIPLFYFMHLLSKLHFITSTLTRRRRKRHPDAPEYHRVPTMEKEMLTPIVWDDAPVCLLDSEGQTPLHTACASGHVEIARLLLHFFPRTAKVRGGSKTPLHLACSANSEELVELLLQELPNDHEVCAAVSATDEEGQTPLHIAAAAGDPWICKRLLELCPEPGRSCVLSVTDVRDFTPLCTACSRGHSAVAQKILEYATATKAGMKIVRVQDRFGKTPLHWACERGLVEVAPKLVEACPDRTEALKMQDLQGKTPLHLATERGNLDILQILLQDKDRDEPPVVEQDMHKMWQREAQLNSERANVLVTCGGLTIILLWLVAFGQACYQYGKEAWLEASKPFWDTPIEDIWESTLVQIHWPAPLFQPLAVECGRQRLYVADRFHVYEPMINVSELVNESDIVESLADVQLRRIDCGLTSTIADMSFGCDEEGHCRPFVLLRGEGNRQTYVKDCAPGSGKLQRLLQSDGPAQLIVMNSTKVLYASHSGEVVRYERTTLGGSTVWDPRFVVASGENLTALGLSGPILWLFRRDGTAEGWDVDRGASCGVLHLRPGIISACSTDMSKRSYILVKSPPPGQHVQLEEAKNLELASSALKQCQERLDVGAETREL